MPFRRKHRNSFFGSTHSADKENACNEPAPASPRLFRCHSDNTQRSCIDINPNTVSSMNNKIKHRNSVLSTKEKMANLLELNSTLVKEVSSLRNSHQAITSDMESLTEELQATSFSAHALRMEKQELAHEVSKLKTAQAEMKEMLKSEKNDAEGRLECVSLVVDNLQSMNGVLAEEAARLREDADRYATERHALLADLDKVMEEKSFLEGFAESVRASEEEFRREMQEALLQAEREKRAMCDQKQVLLEENGELQMASEELKKEVEKIGAERMALRGEVKVLLQEKESLAEEVSASTYTLREMDELLASERKALVSLQDIFDAEKMQMCAEKEELERSLLHLQQKHEKAIRQFDADRQASDKEAREHNLQNKRLSEEKAELKVNMETFQHEICNLQQELVSARDLIMEAELQAKAKIDAREKEMRDVTSVCEREAQDAAKKSADRESELVSTAKALECQLQAAHKALCEEKSHVKEKNNEVLSYTEKLDKATHEISALEGKLVAEKEKQGRLEAHIQTMKGDLLVAEDTAIQAQAKVKAVEKESAAVVEKRSREASQKIGALESNLAAMAERQSDLENHVRFKENAIRAAVQAENVAKGKVKELLDIMQSRGKSIEGNLEALKVSMLEMQKNASEGINSIVCLQAEFASLTDVQANWSVGNKGRKRRGRSRAKAYNQAEHNNFH